MSRPALFELCHVTKSYGRTRGAATERPLGGGAAVRHSGRRWAAPPAQRVFDGVWFTAPACALLGIVGPSGGGKTTLLNLIAGIDAPSDGMVRALGERVPFEDARALALHRARMGFVFQSANLVSHLDVRDNVAMPLVLRGISRRYARGAAERRLGELGLDGLARRHPHELSGGQQQRVAIARALASGARLLLADEPTSALDPSAAAQVLGALRAAAHEHGCAVIVVAHDPTVAGACDALVRCADGELTPLAPVS